MSRGIKKDPEPRLYTRSGSIARIFIEPGDESSEYLGAYWGGSNKWIPVTWDQEGFYLGKEKPCGLDLMLKPEEKDVA